MKWIFLLSFGGFGLAGLIGGALWGAKRWKLQKEGLGAVGTVVELTDTFSTDSKGSRTRSTYPVVEFTTAGGRVVKFRGSTGSNPPSYSVGQRVKLLYRESDPESAQMADFEQLWLGPVVIGLAGLLFFGAGVGAFFLIGDSDREFAHIRERAERDRLELERKLPPRRP